MGVEVASQLDPPAFRLLDVTGMLGNELQAVSLQGLGMTAVSEQEQVHGRVDGHLLCRNEILTAVDLQVWDFEL